MKSVKLWCYLDFPAYGDDQLWAFYFIYTQRTSLVSKKILIQASEERVISTSRVAVMNGLHASMQCCNSFLDVWGFFIIIIYIYFHCWSIGGHAYADGLD